MSKQITVNGRIFEPSATLAKRFGYSLDYVSRLAREEKVKATRVGRQWFVDAISLKNFVDEVALKKDQAREQLRQERKRELNDRVPKVTTEVTPPRHATMYKVESANLPLTHAHTTSSSVTDATWPSSDHQIFKVASATLGSFLVVIAGLLSGIAINPSDFLALVESESNRLTFLDAAQEHNTAGALGSWYRGGSAPETALPPAPDADTGVLVFDEDMTAAEIAKVRASFSDEVDVVYETDDSGIITPVFQDGRGDGYQFLMVPVRDSS